jgi:Na+/H+ antiporter NhaC
MTKIITGLLPILTFIILYCGSGVYFTIQGTAEAFYQISPIVCMLPACILAMLLSRKRFNEKAHTFISGLQDENILVMCLIFLLAGAFSVVTKSIGCAQAAVSVISAHLPAVLWLPGLFVIAAFIATSLGTSMGVIALITPIAVELAHQHGLDMALTVGTVVGAAMFGDNLSMISDTTIASVMSQQASFRDKFILNARIASVAGMLTLILLFFPGQDIHPMHGQAVTYDLIKILPYFVLFALGFARVHVLAVLVLSLLFAGALGLVYGYSLVEYARDITSGFKEMHEIMVLSLLVGGLASLARDQGVIEALQQRLHQLVRRRRQQKRVAELLLASISGIVDFLIANNTIAILLAAPFGKALGEDFKVSAERRAYILDTASCIVQGLIPHGAQLLLAIKISGISYVEVIPYVSYCWILLAVMIGEIFWSHGKKPPVIKAL